MAPLILPLDASRPVEQFMRCTVEKGRGPGPRLPRFSRACQEKRACPLHAPDGVPQLFARVRWKLRRLAAIFSVAPSKEISQASAAPRKSHSHDRILDRTRLAPFAAAVNRYCTVHD